VPTAGQLIRLNQIVPGLQGEPFDSFAYRSADNRCHVLAGQQGHGLQGFVVVVRQPQ
jgi:hypothetical protein